MDYIFLRKVIVVFVAFLCGMLAIGNVLECHSVCSTAAIDSAYNMYSCSLTSLERFKSMRTFEKEIIRRQRLNSDLVGKFKNDLVSMHNVVEHFGKPTKRTEDTLIYKFKIDEVRNASLLMRYDKDESIEICILYLVGYDARHIDIEDYLNDDIIEKRKKRIGNFLSLIWMDESDYVDMSLKDLCVAWEAKVNPVLEEYKYPKIRFDIQIDMQREKQLRFSSGCIQSMWIELENQLGCIVDDSQLYKNQFCNEEEIVIRIIGGHDV